jgi:hypothetical protein
MIDSFIRYSGTGWRISALRLWAVMLMNASPIVIIQFENPKFAIILKDLMKPEKTPPEAREVLMKVVSAAAAAETARNGRPSYVSPKTFADSSS